jgi:hypothetical protein
MTDASDWDAARLERAMRQRAHYLMMCRVLGTVLGLLVIGMAVAVASQAASLVAGVIDGALALAFGVFVYGAVFRYVILRPLGRVLFGRDAMTVGRES